MWGKHGPQLPRPARHALTLDRCFRPPARAPAGPQGWAGAPGMPVVLLSRTGPATGPIPWLWQLLPLSQGLNFCGRGAVWVPAAAARHRAPGWGSKGVRARDRGCTSLGQTGPLAHPKRRSPILTGAALNSDPCPSQTCNEMVEIGCIDMDQGDGLGVGKGYGPRGVKTDNTLEVHVNAPPNVGSSAVRRRGSLRCDLSPSTSIFGVPQMGPFH